MNPPEDVAPPSPREEQCSGATFWAPGGEREALVGIHFHEIRCVFVMLSAPPPVHLSIIKQEVQIGLIPARDAVDAE